MIAATSVPAPIITAKPGDPSKSAQPTNTLIITPLPTELFTPSVLDALRLYFNSFCDKSRLDDSRSPFDIEPATSAPGAGELHTWAPLRGLRRIIVVFYSADEAERARVASEMITLSGLSDPNITLRVFRGTPTPTILEQPPTPDDDDPYDNGEGPVIQWYSPYHLRPPVPTKNFLISPPGSPPAGWEQREEDPPNATPLAEDLIMALEIMQQRREQEERGEDGSAVEFVIGKKRTATSPTETASSMDEEDDGPGEITVRVEDWCDRYEEGADLTYLYPYADEQDDDDEGAHGEGKFDHDGWVFKSTYSDVKKNSIIIPIPTSLPPASMPLPTQFPSRNPPPPMQPTSRPPIPLSTPGMSLPGFGDSGVLRSPTAMPVPTPRPPLPPGIN